MCRVGSRHHKGRKEGRGLGSIWLSTGARQASNLGTRLPNYLPKRWFSWWTIVGSQLERVHVFSVNHFTLPDNANFVGGKRTIALSATSVLPFMTSPCIPTFLLEYGIPIAYHAATSIGSIRLTCDAHTALSKKPQNPSSTTQCLIGEYKGVGVRRLITSTLYY